jgi:serine/threonine protein kinase
MGRYRVLAELGHGGMADVFLAVAEGPAGFNKLLVIKRLRNVEDVDQRMMFLDEARLAARLSHPNIVQTYEVGQEDDRYYIVMEFLDGPTLHRMRRRAKAQGGLPLKIELKILSNILEGLHYAHELQSYDGKPLQVVHRDLTPQNVIVTQLGECKILDFGIAKALDSLSQTQEGIYKGKLNHMPPEQLRGEKVDRTADVFSAGIMLWEAIARRPIWGELGNSAITYQLITSTIPSLREACPDAPAALIEICNIALSADPAARYATAAGMKAAIDGYLQNEGLHVRREELAACVIPLFVEERTRMRALIERQLHTTNIPIPTTRSLAGTLPRIEGSAPGVARLATDQGSEREFDVDVTLSQAPAPPAPRPEAKPISKMRLVALAGTVSFVVTIAVAATLFKLNGGSAMVSPPPPTLTPVPAPAPAPAPVPAALVGPRAAVAPAPVQPEPVVPEAPGATSEALAPRIGVQITAVPEQSRLVLDGVGLNGNPFIGDFPQDNKVHQLRVTSPGYIPLTRSLKFDSDVTVDLALSAETRRVPTRVNRPARAAPSPQVGSTRAEPITSEVKRSPNPGPDSREIDESPYGAAKPAPQTKPKRELDQNNPWQQ